ncbi:MAG: prepilin-type N-terminal cleavage/methylation domain-containing protein [bacterium]
MRSFTPGSPARRRAAQAKSSSGFTLVETVVACTLIMIAMGGAYLLLDSSMNVIRTARDGYAATTISNARLERARMLPYTDLGGMAEVGAVVDDYGLPTTLGRFYRQTGIYTNQPMAGCTKVVVITAARKPGAAPGIYYAHRTLTGVFTPYDMPP